jgi:transglutaminase-like putative cysteine protease
MAIRSSISYVALAAALAAGTTAASAQEVISDQPVQTVITQQPVQTVRTTETVRTVRPAPRSTASRQVVTTRRTTVTERVVPTRAVTTPAIVNTTVVANPRPLYDQAPLYDTVAAPSTIDDAVVNAQVGPGTAIPIYRYVYEPDRILVIDPATGIAVQALPR